MTEKHRWEQICKKAGEAELKELLSLHNQDPYKTTQIFRGKAIVREIGIRKSRQVNDHIDDLVQKIEEK